MKQIEDITKKLEEGVKAVFESDKYKEYLDFMGKFYNYSVNNIILILSQKPDASLVAGYKTWQSKFKRQVQKGAKAIKILAPCPHKAIKVVDGEEKEICWTSFRAVSVFDVSQTDGDALPTGCVEPLTGTVESFDELMKKLEKVSPVPIGFEDIQTGANGYYKLNEKRIVVKSGMSEMQTIKTLIHEIAHAILHDKDSGEAKDADRHSREVQAESVAYIVCNALGLDTSDYSFGYVASWSTGHEVKELVESLDVIRKTAIEMVEAL